MPKSVLDNLCNSIWLWEDKDKREAYYQATQQQFAPAAPPRDVLKQLATVARVRSQVAREILEKVFSLYPVRNAWSSLSFGSNNNGIHRATLDDPMHYNSTGLFSYLAQIAFGGLLPKEAQELEEYLREDFSMRSSVRYDLPRGKFSSGFTNCTLLTASEKVGIIYALYFSLGTPRVASIYQKAILRQQRKYIDITCFTQGSESTPSATFPTIDDQYFFKKPSQPCQTAMLRTPGSVRGMIQDLNKLGLLQGIEEAVLHLDSLQTEYLLQAVWDRITSSRDKPHLTLPGVLSDNVTDSSSTLEGIVLHVQSKVRKKPMSNQKQGGSHATPALPTTIQKKIAKHWLNKPKCCGSGDTSSILTDVKGFREVLELALVFHSTIHEYHQLDKDLQFNFQSLKLKLDALLSTVFSRIYRGDNGIDVRTCKCHSHFHLTEDIKYYGAPMGFDASKGERNLKSWAKWVSKTARKCGQSIFIQQTAKRVSDHLVLQRATHLVEPTTGRKNLASLLIQDISNTNNQTACWKYTRKQHHILYDMGSECASLVQCSTLLKNSDPMNLLTAQVRRVLKHNHGRNGGMIRIWKGIKIHLGNGDGHHHVRACHDFDSHGKFFDWVQVKDVGSEGSYLPAKVLLLYQTELGQNFSLVWKAKAPTDAERKLETNLSARWKMDLLSSGLPRIVSIPTEVIERCILVHEHWKCPNKHHLPSTPFPPGSDTSKFTIDEAYDRYSWVLNFLDEERWSPTEY